MELRCPSCGATVTVPDDNLPPEGARARCHSCHEVSVYQRGGLVADDPTPAGGMAAMTSAVAGDADATPPRGLPRAQPAAASMPAATGTSASPGGAEWMLRTAAGDEGHLSLDDVKRRIREGKLGADDLACPPGAADWIRVGDLPSLQRWLKLAAGGGKGAGAAKAPVADVASCTRHPGVRGRWLCPACGNLACDACAPLEEVARVQVRLCPACRKVCNEFVPTKKITPFWQEVPQLLTYPVRGLGWLALIVFPLMGIAAVLCKAAAMAFALAHVGRGFFVLSIYAYHLYIISHTTKGGRSMPNLASVSDYVEELLKPAGKAALVSLLLFLPAGWAWNGVKGARAELGLAEGLHRSIAEDRAEWERIKDDPEAAREAAEDSAAEFEQAMQQITDPSELSPEELGQAMGQALGAADFREDRDFEQEEADARAAVSSAKSRLATRRLLHGIALACALGIWPMFLIIVALFNTIMPALQPQVLVKLIAEIPREYGWCTLMTSACFLGIFALNLPLRGHPILGDWLTSPATYYLSCIAFYVMGRTAELAEREIDWH